MGAWAVPTLAVAGVEVHFSEQGSGEAAVFVHAGGSDGSQWRGVGQSLAGAWRILAIDLYGHGRSGAPPGLATIGLDECALPVIALVRQCAGKVHLVGHSFGGAVALRAALAARERLASLTLIEPNSFTLLRQAGEHDLYADIRREAEHFMGAVQRDAGEEALERFVNFWNGAPGMWTTLPEHVRTDLLGRAKPIAAGWHALLADPTLAEECRQFGLPTLVMHGRRTIPAFHRLTELLAELLPDSRRVSIEGAGHMSPVTHPQPVAEAIAGFLAKHDPA